MTIETILRKRKASFKGEVGLFPDNEMADSDLRSISMDTDVLAKVGSPKNIQLQKYAWALATKITENTDRWLDKDDAMDWLKRQARFAKMVRNEKTNDMELVAKSMKRLSNEALQRLVNRFEFIVREHVLPGVSEKTLREEIEAMITRTR